MKWKPKNVTIHASDSTSLICYYLINIEIDKISRFYEKHDNLFVFYALDQVDVLNLEYVSMTFEDQVVVSDSVPRIFRRLLYWQLKNTHQAKDDITKNFTNMIINILMSVISKEVLWTVWIQTRVPKKNQKNQSAVNCLLLNVTRLFAL